MITLYHVNNSRSARSLWLLYELDLEFELVEMAFTMEALRTPEYLAISPLGRVPCLRDGELTIFESGAILLYLAEKTGQLLPTDPAGRYGAIQWLMFQMGGIGPMFGQLGYFYRGDGKAIDDKRPKDRYIAETRRLNLDDL